MLHDGDLVPAPFTPWALASSSQLTITQKWEVTRFLALLHTIDARHWERRTLGELLDRYTSTPLTRRLLKMFVAIATFGHSNQMSAGAALRQLKVGLAGVRYPDGGFQSLVDGLVRVAEETGVDLRCGVAATGVRRGQVATRQRSLNADAIVLAVPPRVAEKLADVEFGPQRATRMATLDVVLDQAPRAPDNVIDLERAIYLSFHSPVAELGDGVVLHSAKYLDPFAPFDADATRAEVESLLDRAQPGWRDQVSYVRFLPRIAVNHWFCDAESGGQPGRPDISLGDGMYVAGDWVGDEGMLTDAAMASGRRAALVALEDQRRAAA